MDELISIIMPAYNAEKYLEETILSVTDQTYPYWELIIVNDGSTDDTQQIAEAYQSRDSRISVINQTNTGQGGARNAAFKVAKGAWLAFLDADDLWVKTKLEQQIKRSADLPAIDIFFSAGWKFEKTVASAEGYDITTGAFNTAEIYKQLYQVNYIPILSVMLKKTVADSVGLMDERRQIQNCEDWDYWLRMAIHGAKFYGMQERLFYYRRHSGNNSADKLKLRLAELAVLIKNHRPGLLTQHETKAAFVPLVNSLIIDLVTAGRKTEAERMISDINGLLPGHAKMYRLLLNASNKHTIKIFHLANRVYLKAGKVLKK